MAGEMVVSQPSAQHQHPDAMAEVQAASPSADDTVLKLPHPYLTEYTVRRAGGGDLWQLRERAGSSQRPTPEPLDSPGLFFSQPAGLRSSELPPGSDNSGWARARRAPCSTVAWDGGTAPTLAQAWLLLYLLFTVGPGMEALRLELRGPGAGGLARQLTQVLLAVGHPEQPGGGAATEHPGGGAAAEALVLALRSTFWQGAGSPFGPRPVWCPDASPASTPLAAYPLTPLHHTLTAAPAGDPRDPGRCQQSWHPLRPAKPAPGAVVYSRWIPHLNETLSMLALDWHDAEHVRLFHDWQNDPRVSQGWNETGTLEQHRRYLARMHHDPHQMAVLARWDETYFAYFEVYWAKEDRLGGYYHAGDFDRGRHSLVGDVRFRGPHRVSAWWSSLVHYLFLDDPRTMCVVGEPNEANSTVVMYDLMHGFALDGFVDLPHKRSALVRCPRPRFFQLCPLAESDKTVGGVRIGLVPKL